MSEAEFWSGRGLELFAIALALWACTGDDEAGLLIIQENMNNA